MTIYKLSPSKAHRYLNCPASLMFDTEFVETPITIRGKNLHKLGEMYILQQETEKFIEENNFNDYELFLCGAYATCVEQQQNLYAGAKLQIEQKESLNIYGNKINFIIDALIISKLEKTAVIIDLKTGNHDVDVEENEQLYYYAYGMIIKYPYIEKIIIGIFQKGKLKSETITRSDVLNFFVDKADVFDKINKDELYYNPGEKQCRYCENKDKCMARAEWILSTKRKNIS